MTDGLTGFDPVAFLPALAGGAMIGLASLIMLVFLGRVTGVSGIIAAALSPASQRENLRWSGAWRWAFIIGLVIAAPLYGALTGNSETGPLAAPLTLAVAGLLVGVGAGVGSGCTSGHGVCGLARRSWRSLIATGVFMTAAAVTVFITRHIIGS